MKSHLVSARPGEKELVKLANLILNFQISDRYYLIVAKEVSSKIATEIGSFSLETIILMARNNFGLNCQVTDSHIFAKTIVQPMIS